MKKLLISVVGISIAVSTPSAAIAQQAASQADSAAKLTEAGAIIEIMFPAAERQAMMEKMMDSISGPMRQSMPSNAVSDPGFQALVNEFLDEAQRQQRPLMQKHLPRMFDAMAAAYTNQFTLAELKDVHAFAQTPSGRHYLSRSTALVSDPAVVAANTALFADAQAVMTKILPPFREKLMAYLKGHPEIAEQLAKDKEAK